MKLFEKSHRLVSSAYGLPVVVLVLGILAYGIHIPWLGFYWDDWPWVWFSHVMGPGGMLQIDAQHRPLSGLVLALGSWLAGENPIGWQIYTFGFRILGCLTLAWALRGIWPRRYAQVSWVAVLFLVYPGFGQQFVAVNNSRHLFPLVTFFLSLGFMVRAGQKAGRYWLFNGISLALALLTMFTTEYYYGLELVRPLVLWLARRDQECRKGKLWAAVFRSWLPYLVPLVGVFSWRYAVSKSINYQITLFEELSTGSPSTLAQRVWGAVQDLFSAGIGSWLKIVDFPDPALFGLRPRLYAWGLALLSAMVVFIYWRSNPGQKSPKGWGVEAILLGSGFLLVAPIPFWVTELDIRLSFPFDRLTLPMMVGSCLFLAGIAAVLVKHSTAKLLLLSLVTGLAVGSHYQNGVGYRRDWQHQVQFLRELTWRIPGLEEGTALFANELPTTYSTDNSLTAPLNWIYAPEFSGGELPFHLFYVDLRFGGQGFPLEYESLTRENYRFYPFTGSLDNVLVLYNQPPSCTRVLSFDLHQQFPGLPSEILAVLPYSNGSRIKASDASAADIPLFFPAVSRNGSWCYYFESADLARQRGAWEQVAAFGDMAFQVGYPDSPVKHVNEYAVFIEGYAHVGMLERARELTYEAYEIDPQMGPMLCDTWGRVLQAPDPPTSAFQVFDQVESQLNCSFSE